MTLYVSDLSRRRQYQSFSQVEIPAAGRFGGVSLTLHGGSKEDAAFKIKPIPRAVSVLSDQGNLHRQLH